MAQNIANFIISNNLDGVDIDWEYPAAPDIPDIPSADPVEGGNYLQFLTTLRSLLPASKSVSFAAPASFWYLQGFPIAKIMKVVDYVIYMTYDLHGQVSISTCALIQNDGRLTFSQPDIVGLRKSLEYARLFWRQLSPFPREHDRDSECSVHDH